MILHVIVIRSNNGWFNKVLDLRPQSIGSYSKFWLIQLNKSNISKIAMAGKSYKKMLFAVLTVNFAKLLSLDQIMEGGVIYFDPFCRSWFIL